MHCTRKVFVADPKHHALNVKGSQERTNYNQIIPASHNTQLSKFHNIGNSLNIDKMKLEI